MKLCFDLILQFGNLFKVKFYVCHYNSITNTREKLINQVDHWILTASNMRRYHHDMMSS